MVESGVTIGNLAASSGTLSQVGNGDIAGSPVPSCVSAGRNASTSSFGTDSPGVTARDRPFRGHHSDNHNLADAKQHNRTAKWPGILRVSSICFRSGNATIQRG